MQGAAHPRLPLLRRPQRKGPALLVSFMAARHARRTGQTTERPRLGLNQEGKFCLPWTGRPPHPSLRAGTCLPAAGPVLSGMGPSWLAFRFALATRMLRGQGQRGREPQTGVLGNLASTGAEKGCSGESLGHRGVSLSSPCGGGGGWIHREGLWVLLGPSPWIPLDLLAQGLGCLWLLRLLQGKKGSRRFCPLQQPPGAFQMPGLLHGRPDGRGVCALNVNQGQSSDGNKRSPLGVADGGVCWLQSQAAPRAWGLWPLWLAGC